MKIKKLTILAVVGLVAAFMALTGAPTVAQAADCGGDVPCSCGDTVVEDTVLTGSLDCSGGDGLIIGAHGVTLELNGFVLEGDLTSGKIGVDNTGGFSSVTIQYGVIQGFDQGLKAADVDGLELKDLAFSGQNNRFDGRAIDVLGGKDVQIKHSSFTMPTPEFLGTEAIRLESVDNATVDHVVIHGGFVGVNFACGVCDGTEPPTNGEVKNSVIQGAFIGVFLANTTDATVQDNHISGGVELNCTVATCGFDFDIPGKGILAQSQPKTPLTTDSLSVVTNALIQGNHVHDTDGFGILLQGATDSEVKTNDVHLNTKDGIALLVAEDPVPDIPSTGSLIQGNTSTGNGGDDLSHDVGSTPNTWTDNICETKTGADIPAC